MSGDGLEPPPPHSRHRVYQGPPPPRLQPSSHPLPPMAVAMAMAATPRSPASLKRKSPTSASEYHPVSIVSSPPLAVAPTMASSSLSLSSSPPPPPPPASYAQTVVVAVERSILRSVAFVLYHLDRPRARGCVRAILEWYWHLHTHLPVCAAASLEHCATSFVALSDAEFTTFWLALLEQPDHPTAACANAAALSAMASPSVPTTAAAATTMAHIDTHEMMVDIAPAEPESVVAEDATLVQRLYRQIMHRIQRLLRFPMTGDDRSPPPWHAQTPLTSPDDKCDESHYQRQHAASRRWSLPPTQTAPCSLCAAGGCLGHLEDDPGHLRRVDQLDATTSTHHSSADGGGRAFVPVEPGWAVEYMEAESRVPTEMTRRMRKMMHTSIPLNLFRVAVVYPPPDEDLDDLGLGPLGPEDLADGGFVGIISPESFPPTPITRDIQTRRVHHYTVTVLDHATLALRLLEANAARRRADSRE